MKRFTLLALFALAAVTFLLIGCDRSLPNGPTGPNPGTYDAIGVSGRSVMYFNPSDGATVSRPAQTTPASAFLLRFSWSCQPIEQYFVLYRRDDGTAPDVANRVRSIWVGSRSQSWVDVDLGADIPAGLYVWGVELADGGRSQLQGLGIK